MAKSAGAPAQDGHTGGIHRPEAQRDAVYRESYRRARCGVRTLADRPDTGFHPGDRLFGRRPHLAGAGRVDHQIDTSGSFCRVQAGGGRHVARRKAEKVVLRPDYNYNLVPVDLYYRKNDMVVITQRLFVIK